MDNRVNRYSAHLPRGRTLQAAVASPLTKRILSDERWYRDGPPAWAGAPTQADAQEDRKACVKRLNRLRSFKNSTALATLLASCSPGDRCMSGACPECSPAFQRWFVESV